MKTLYLLRHAKSSWKYPELPDLERPLNKRGKRDAPRMGRWLKEQEIVPEHIISSHSLRTLATISKIAHVIGLKGERIAADPTLYHASPSRLLTTIRSCSPELKSLMLVGHNPGLTELAGQLCPAESVENIPTCGLYAIQFHCTHWKEAGTETASFLSFQYPKKLPV